MLATTPLRSRAARLAVAAAAAVSLSACAGMTPGAPSAAGGAAPVAAATPKVDLATWTDQVCGTMVTLTDAAQKQPTFDTSSAKAVIAGLVTYLDDLESAVDTANAGLKAAGPAPADGGDALVAKMSSAYTAMRDAVEKAKVDVQKADPTDPAALESAMEPLKSLDQQLSPLEHLDASPEIDAAAADAPNCKKLNSLS